MFLKVENLTVYYGAVKALANISLEVDKGEFVTIIGPNGAGKSTVLKSICGLLGATGGRISSGNMIFLGESIKNIPPHHLVRKGISVVPEGRRVFTTMTVNENLEMGSYILNKSLISRRELSGRFNSVFRLFPALVSKRKQKAGTLSGGEQQMLAIGRALMLEPHLLILDEPSLGLSPNYVRIVFEKLEEINKNGISILLVEQNARMALDYSDRAYVFKVAELWHHDTSENLLKNNEIKKYLFN
jgi:branched-chain amino acid transport system ATP-binding protein